MARPESEEITHEGAQPHNSATETRTIALQSCRVQAWY